MLSADGSYCYYVVDDEKLCYSKNGKKGKELLEKDEVITSIISANPDVDKDNNLMFFTKKGLVKRTNVREFDSIRKNGSYEEKSIEELLK